MFALGAAFKSALVLIACAAAAFADAEEMKTRIATSDPDRGKTVFRKCIACHSAEKDGKARSGPNLWGIVGASVAAREGFLYSKAMKKLRGDWTFERLDAYLAHPNSLVKGTSMSFAGLKRDRDRADVIAFLTLMSDDPPEYVNPPSASEAPALPENPEFGILVSAPGAQETFDSCNACHSERIVAQQGLAREQWEELLELMVDEHGMEPIGGSVRESILDYLAEHYGPDRPNYPFN